MTSIYTIGQCWASSTEPDLGIGKVVQVETRRISLFFEAGGEKRIYSRENPPLNRVLYRSGDMISVGKKSIVIRHVHERDGLVYYHDGTAEVCECELDPDFIYNRPQDLFGKVAGNNAQFELRRQAYNLLHEYHTSPLRGLLGGRIDLIPHQFYVVDAVVNQDSPRVLLADEAGLGKTIEACMILHRRRLQGQADRVLVLVPDALVHQWFVELLRRFNLKASIFDEERCNAIEKNPEAGNPFLEDQLVICALSWLVNTPLRALQAVQAGWDMLIVDEAHHLEWNEMECSSEYAVVEALVEQCESVLLLTATPEETGEEGHFARLRLLDPDRYSSLEQFRQDNKEYNGLVPVVEALEDGHSLDAHMQSQLVEWGLNPDDTPEQLLGAIIDCYGPGRVIFRNTRRIIKGFPRRFVHPEALAAGEDGAENWLIRKIRSLKPAKVLVILQFAEDALALYDFIRKQTGISVGVFHENMTLIQRDRQAAWFADPEGAQVLIASEIGGEGRNFQFAHHLVFMDMPANPEISEQRIGRLDRIGQQHAIHIHIPYLTGSRDEKHMLWQHEAIDALNRPLAGAHEIYSLFRSDLEDNSLYAGSEQWKKFMDNSCRKALRITNRIIHGRDRLLQLHSYRADTAQQLIDAIKETDRDTKIEEFLLNFFEVYGIYPEIIENRCWLLTYSPIISDIFPGFPKDGMLVTFDRRFAIEREDIGFVTWDHPLVRGAIDLILATTEGTAVEILCEQDSCLAINSRFLVEFLFIMEPLAADSETAHYLPAVPVSVVLDEEGREWTNKNAASGCYRDFFVNDPDKDQCIQSFIDNYLFYAEDIAQKGVADEKHQAYAAFQQTMREATCRKGVLKGRTRHRSRERQSDMFSSEEVDHGFGKPAMRLDAIRWIWNK